MQHIFSNVRKSPAKGFCLVILKTPETNIIIPFWPSYYMLQNPQNTISQNSLKHHNKFISVIPEDLRWLQITKDTGKKIKAETKVK